MGDSDERSVEIDFYRSGGPGGQKKNKTFNAVRLRHIPTGIVVTASERRSRRENLKVAFDRLRRRLEVARRRRKLRRSTAPSRSSRERRMEAKHKRAQVKRTRGRVAHDDDG